MTTPIVPLPRWTDTGYRCWADSQQDCWYGAEEEEEEATFGIRKLRPPSVPRTGRPLVTRSYL
jgi:hypothetical protein